jgi:hypothetical protein
MYGDYAGFAGVELVTSIALPHAVHHTVSCSSDIDRSNGKIPEAWCSVLVVVALE